MKWTSLLLLSLACVGFAGRPASAQQFSEGYSGGNCGRGECYWISAEGQITPGGADRLAAFLQERKIDPSGKWLVINSPGGDLGAGIELGRMIRGLGMSARVGQTGTEVPEGAGREFQFYDGGICASACVFVLMGGREREVADEDSKVGIHQFAPADDRLTSSVETTSNAQSAVALLQAYAVEMDVEPSIIGLSSAVPASEILWLTNAQMEGLNLLTSRARPPASDWELKPTGTTLLAVATQEQSNGYRVTYLLDCNRLSVLFPLDIPEKGADLIDAIVGASIETSDGTRSGQLGLLSKEIHGDSILLSFASGASLMRTLALGEDSLQLSLGYPYAYSGIIRGRTFAIPSSNLSELEYHVQASCGR